MISDLKISELYQLDVLTGEQYLFCVEHDMNTVSDVFQQVSNTNSSLEKIISSIQKFAEKEGLISDNVIKEPKDTPIDKEPVALMKAIDSIIQGSSARVRHALIDIFENKCNCSLERLYAYLSNPNLDLASLRNIGKGSLEELRLRVYSIIGLLSGSEELSINDLLQGKKNNSPLLAADIISTDVQDSLPLIKSIIERLSVRSKTVLKALLVNECNESVGTFYSYISADSFNPKDLRNIGRTSLPEVKEALEKIKTIVENYKLSPDGVVSSRAAGISSLAAKEAFIQLMLSIGITTAFDAEALHSLSLEIGHFPLFKAISMYIESMPIPYNVVANNRLDIYNDRELVDRELLARELRLSGERIRQLTRKCLVRINSFIKGITVSLSDELSFYNPSRLSVINPSEGTFFNESFLNWAISIVNDKYAVIGNVEKCFFNPYNKDEILDICPVELTEIYSFDEFIQFFESLYQERRFDDEDINLSSIVDKFFINKIVFERREEIKVICSRLIRRSYDCIFHDGFITLSSNATRNLPELVEIILKRAGRALTAEEIFSILSIQNPGRCKSLDALPGSIIRSENIVPLGRTKTYGLKEWQEGANRGGTIREFALEYLLSLDVPAAKIEEIGNAVRVHRPTSSNSSIQSNLLLETTGRFALYKHNGETYIGLTSFPYDDSFELLSLSREQKRDVKTSFTLLEDFIIKQNRFPFSTAESPEEERLARFWYNMTYSYKRGKLKETEKAIVESIVNRFGPLQITKDEYEWKRRFNGIIESINQNGLSSIQKADLSWMGKWVKLFLAGKTATWQNDYIKKLYDILSIYAN